MEDRKERVEVLAELCCEMFIVNSDCISLLLISFRFQNDGSFTFVWGQEFLQVRYIETMMKMEDDGKWVIYAHHSYKKAMDTIHPTPSQLYTDKLAISFAQLDLSLH